MTNAKRTAVVRQSSPTNCTRSMGMGNAEPLTMVRVESALCLDGEGPKTIHTAPLVNAAMVDSDATLRCSHRKIIVCALSTFILHATIIFIKEFAVDDRADALIKPEFGASDETDLILKASLLNIKGELLEKERLRLAAMKRYAESIGLSQPSPNPRVVGLQLNVKKRSKI